MGFHFCYLSNGCFRWIGSMIPLQMSQWSENDKKGSTMFSGSHFHLFGLVISLHARWLKCVANCWAFAGACGGNNCGWWTLSKLKHDGLGQWHWNYTCNLQILHMMDHHGHIHPNYHNHHWGCLHLGPCKKICWTRGCFAIGTWIFNVDAASVY